jgi:hypothetical protein
LKKNINIAFLVLFTILISCKKENSTIGKDGLSSDKFLNSDAIDTFQLETYTVLDDSLLSSNLTVNMLGSYQDPVFGSVNADFYTQFRLSGFNPVFGDLSTIVMDSFVLGMEYRGYYGNLDPQTFEVYELDEALSSDSIYYSYQIKTVKPQNLVMPGKGTITPTPETQTIIGGQGVEPQIRIFLDTTFARNLMLEGVNNPSTYSSNELFLQYFKGLQVKVNNPGQGEGKGGILYFNNDDPLSKLTIYYSQAGVSKAFDFYINSDCADFNHVLIDNSSKNVGNVINNINLGNKEFYAQANKSRAVVKFTTIDKIPKNAVIQYAQLNLPVSYYTLDPFFPSSTISAATKINSSDKTLYSLNIVGIYSDFTKSYNVDVRDYVQKIVNGKIENLGVYLSPSKMLSSTERIVFNGALTENKNQPKLYIIYTNY